MFFHTVRLKYLFWVVLSLLGLITLRWSKCGCHWDQLPCLQCASVALLHSPVHEKEGTAKYSLYRNCIQTAELLYWFENTKQSVFNWHYFYCIAILQNFFFTVAPYKHCFCRTYVVLKWNRPCYTLGQNRPIWSK